MPPSVAWAWIAVATATWVAAAVFTTTTLPQGVAPGPYQGKGTVVSDLLEGRYQDSVLVSTDLGVLLADVVDVALDRGDVIRFAGELFGDPGRRGHIAYVARLRISKVDLVETGANLPLVVGDALRRRVTERLSPMEDGRGLLAGFLIGDTSGVDVSDIDAMRKTGLSHFVAVSGSNVGLWLGMVALVAGPLALGPKRRAVVGLLALPVYAAATRFEPSVMRASVMAGLILAGRLVGVVLEAWQVLSLAVVALLVFEPALTQSVGFQLSVAATAGVLIGARWPIAGGTALRALVITVSAQIMVAPLILIHFGTVPLMSPLINLVAAPLVATSTVLGSIGVAGLSPMVDLAAWLAGLVLTLARATAHWPQLGSLAVVGVMAAAAAAIGWSRLRPVLAIGSALVIANLVLGVGMELPSPGVVVLDVGQGDSILVHGGGGHTLLVDGGPDPVVLMDKLRTYGVTRLDHVVLTHVHADHATGLSGVVGRMSIGRFWIAAAPHFTPAIEELVADLTANGVPISRPTVGQHIPLGSLDIEVEGPLRRYASPNDQSVVLEVKGPRRSMLLTGDIETYAQAELRHLRADVLKVPHQGAGTSDQSWLLGIGAELAVISVGTNTFGHPADWVLDAFESRGTRVLRTDEDGDVAVQLG